ncbi:cysteine desulfurase family protein [Sphingosinithalassobacter sp. LHW66-3]|uniref:cysteine desulfurase family protein n=1 Tax=Sphingosinithalassobacter sp. LHW66-3 TaxID=3424718 RepID=UPI003D6AB7AD
MTQPIYLDHNASTPTDPFVIERMISSMRAHVANASSVDHAWGNAAHQAVETARSNIAARLGARPSDLVFTSGATEANNIAIRGAFRAGSSANRRQILTAASEHPSVLQTVLSLEAEGAEVVVLPVDEEGRIDLKEFRAALVRETALVTIMGANNETGVIHPAAEIAAICAEAGVPYHCDLTQLAAHLPVDLSALGVTLASLSGHKMYGPRGIGILFARSRRPRARLVPSSTGGGQERGLRPGTLNTEAILGMEAAFDRRADWLPGISELESKRDALQQALISIPGLNINGGAAPRIPNTLNVSIAGVDPHALQHRLRDQLIFSTGSACATDKVHSSTVLSAMFGPSDRTRTGFRLGLGVATSDADVARAAELIKAGVSMLRSGQMGALNEVVSA